MTRSREEAQAERRGNDDRGSYPMVRGNESADPLRQFLSMKPPRILALLRSLWSKRLV